MIEVISTRNMEILQDTNQTHGPDHDTRALSEFEPINPVVYVFKRSITPPQQNNYS